MGGRCKQCPVMGVFPANVDRKKHFNPSPKSQVELVGVGYIHFARDVWLEDKKLVRLRPLAQLYLHPLPVTEEHCWLFSWQGCPMSCAQLGSISHLTRVDSLSEWKEVIVFSLPDVSDTKGLHRTPENTWTVDLLWTGRHLDVTCSRLLTLSQDSTPLSE